MGRFADTRKHNPERLKDADWLQKNHAFTGEVFLGHLRYGTYGRNTIERVHPFLRQNNWPVLPDGSVRRPSPWPRKRSLPST